MRGTVRAAMTIGVAILTIGARASARAKPFTVVETTLDVISSTGVTPVT